MMGGAGLEGQTLDGRYQVIRRLGEGHVCVVYEARHVDNGRHFAIKALRPELAAKPGVRELFVQQVQAARRIQHPSVVTIYEGGTTPDASVYASIELVIAPTLQAIIDREGRWTWAKVRPVALQIVSALDAAHRLGIVHQAIQPAKCFIMLDPKGKRDPLVKVSSFGLAAVGVLAHQAAPGQTVTTFYGDAEMMAPEQGMTGTVSPSSDLYSLGVLLFRALGGQVPFSSPNSFQVVAQHVNKPVPSLRSLESTVPPALEQVILGCLGKTPDQRYDSAAALGQALAAVPTQAVGVSPPVAASASRPRFARLNQGRASLAAVPSDSSVAAPSKRPSVIIAGAIGEPAPPATVAPPGGRAPMGDMTASFLASRPSLRMGLGAAVSGDGPAPPATVAPGMAVPSPTIAPGFESATGDALHSDGLPRLSREIGPGMPLPAGGFTPSGANPAMPGAGGYSPPSGPGAGMPGAGGYSPPSDPGAGMPGAGGYSPPSGPGAGMPGAGGYSPPSGLGMSSGGGYGSSMGSDPGGPTPETSSILDEVEYDDEETASRRPLLIAGIAIVVVLGGAGLGWLIVGGSAQPEGALAKVARAQRTQPLDDDSPEPEPPSEPEPPPEPEQLSVPVEPTPKPKATPLTFSQSLRQLEGRIRGRCKPLGAGPVTIDALVTQGGQRALAPKVSPEGPVGDCARRIITTWTFPSSEHDHPIDIEVSW